MVSTILVFALISGVLLLVGFIALLFTDFENPISFFIFIFGCAIALVIAGVNAKEHIDTKAEVIEIESTESYTEDLFDLNVFKTNTESKIAIEEEFPEKVDSNTETTEVVTETAETIVNETEDAITEEDSELKTSFIVISIIGSCFLLVVLAAEEGIVYDIKESIKKSKEKKRLKTKAKTEQKKEASSNTSKEVFANTEKMLKNIASSDSKVEYILWAVNYLDENGKADNTRKLKNYYIPEILKAQAQFKKIKSFGMDEMTTEAKKHYKKIISLAYSVAKAEVKKAASEILMDMDCNANVCEDIYKKDGYSSMREEIQESHTMKKKEENYF